MKKTPKKLVLAKETVRHLSRIESSRVGGGAETDTCGCYTGTCGTGYCTGGGSGACTVQCWSDPQYTCQNEFLTERNC